MKPNAGSSRSHRFETTDYYALEAISRWFRSTAWINAIVLVLLGIAVLTMDSTVSATTRAGSAIMLLVIASMQWLVLKAISEGLIIFVNIAQDVRAIATRR
jgi:hypothetical protein